MLLSSLKRARSTSSILDWSRARGVKIVVYSRTRVYLDRDAWEMLPPDAVLLMQMRPTDAVAYSLAFTAAELEAVFGEARRTRSWDQVRCYHFPSRHQRFPHFGFRRSLAATPMLVVVHGSSHPPCRAPPITRRQQSGQGAAKRRRVRARQTLAAWRTMRAPGPHYRRAHDPEETPCPP